MGQYYMGFATMGNKKKSYIFYSHDYDNGLKLTEHSWIGNNFINAFCSKILNNPMYVAWIGDYAEDSPNHDGLVKSKEQFMIYAKKAWRENNNPCHNSPEIPFGNYYLVNHTKHLYINMAKYVTENQFDGRWCHHPLPLLTACGNGLGGGDYYGINENLIGSWAFDKISLEYESPKEYSSFMPHFKEKGWR